jgi:hypothetical protein
MKNAPFRMKETPKSKNRNRSVKCEKFPQSNKATHAIKDTGRSIA